MSSNFPCCELADHPHEHIKDTQRSRIINPVFSTVFRLQTGYIIPVEYVPREMSNIRDLSAKYFVEDLVFFGDHIYECTADSTGYVDPPQDPEKWSVFGLRKQWRGRYIKNTNYIVGDLVHSADYIYQSISDCIGRLPQENTAHWKCLGATGRKFPPWMEHSNWFGIDVNMGNTMYVSPNTGMPCWDIIPEKYIGREEVAVSSQHQSIQKVFVREGKTSVTQIYTIKSIHCGKCKLNPTDDNPNPSPAWFLGFTIGAYILPASVDNTDATTTNTSEQFDSLMPLVDARSGKQYSTIYLQWKADEMMPFIMQGDNLLWLRNRTPHPKYMELFADSMKCAHYCNTIDTSPEAFTNYFNSHNTSSNLTTDTINVNDYYEWVKEQLVKKHTNLVTANKKWETANTAWKNWLWKLRMQPEEFRDACNRIAQAAVGVQEWLIGENCDEVSWSITEDGRDVSVCIGDILAEADKIDRLWDIIEQAIGGLTTYYVEQAEEKIKTVKKWIAAGNATYLGVKNQPRKKKRQHRK